MISSSVVKVMRQLYMRPIPPLGQLLSRLCVSRIKKAKYKIRKNFIDFAFGFRIIRFLAIVFPISQKYGALVEALKFLPIVFSIRASQIQKEIESLLKILSRSQPKYVMEIGTANGEPYSYSLK